jgi:hypothetical protein
LVEGHVVEGHGERWEPTIVNGNTLRRRSRKPPRQIHLSFLRSLRRCTYASTWPLILLFHCCGHGFIVAFDSDDEALEFEDL